MQARETEMAEYMDERFLGIEKRMGQGIAHAEMAREQDFVHINPRLDDMNKRFDALRNTMLMLYIPVAWPFRARW